MNRLEKKIHNNVSFTEISKYYGPSKLDIFKKEGITKLLEYEPFEMMTFVNQVIDWFDKDRIHPKDINETELYITHPTTLYSLDDYTGNKIDKSIVPIKRAIVSEHGLKEDFCIFYYNILDIDCSVIYNTKINEVLFLIFRSDDTKEIHDTFFTNKIYKYRNECGTV
ncbi:hypothetical protein [Lacinutrix cladophorae]